MCLLQSMSLLSKYRFICGPSSLDCVYSFHMFSCLLFSVNKCPDDQVDAGSWDTWLLDDNRTYTCIRQYYDTEAGQGENVTIFERGGAVESDYEDDE